MPDSNSSKLPTSKQAVFRVRGRHVALASMLILCAVLASGLARPHIPAEVGASRVAAALRDVGAVAKGDHRLRHGVSELPSDVGAVAKGDHQLRHGVSELPRPSARGTLCQALGPAAPYPIKGLDCASGACGEHGWADARPIAWQRFAQGEYTGHARTAHVRDYRLRPGDVLDFVFRLTREATPRAYRFKVGDRLRIELLADPDLKNEVEIQADGMIVVRLIGPVRAARLTMPQLRDVLENRYARFYRQPSVTVTPLRVNSRLEDLRASVDDRFGSGGQTRRATVTPEGTVQLPVIHSVSVQGLTLYETQHEIEARYAEAVSGMEVVPVLVSRARRFVYVVGEVRRPGRYELVAPTTLMQSIALAGGWNYGGNLHNTVIFRRGDDWRLMASSFDLRGSLYGHRPCPADEVWINDSDVVLVPKSRVLVFENVVALLFREGIFRVAPFHSGFGDNSVRYSGTPPRIPILPSGPTVIPIIAPTSPAAPSIPTPPVGPPAPAPVPGPVPSPTPPIPLPA